MTPLLEVKNLHVSYSTRTDELGPALAGVNFDLGSGEILGVLGEPGSGKSTLAASLLRLLPANGKIQKGFVLFEGKELLDASPQDLRKIRGGRIGPIFQELSSSLHPTLQVGQQVSDVLAAHECLARRALNEKTSQLLDPVAIPRKMAARRADELSGGQKQPLAIARALSLEPKLLILDEALSSQDCSVQAHISNLLLELQASLGLTYLFITHDFAMAAHMADQIAVMDRGHIVESGPAEKILSSPNREATRSLIAATPRFIETPGVLVHS
jgi:ABC-type glutathione transport system ATPase component